MLTLLGLPMMGGRMMVKGGEMMQGGWLGNLMLFYHVLVGLLFLTLLFLAVVYMWKKVEMMDHDMDHHHNHK